MKTQIRLYLCASLTFIAFHQYQHTTPVNAMVGESVWHLANQIEGCLETLNQQNPFSHNHLVHSILDKLCIIESEVDTFNPTLNKILTADESIFEIICNIEQTFIDGFDGTFTSIPPIFDKLCTADSKLDFLPAELNSTLTQLIPVLDKSIVDLSIIDFLLTASADLLSSATLFEAIEQELITSITLLNGLIDCKSLPITSPQAISTSGTYCLSNSITGPITINANNVDINLNGFTINGGTNGIVVNPGFINITIHDGIIDGWTSSTNGIFINAATFVHINNVDIVNCTNGLQLLNTQACQITECTMNSNTIGMKLAGSNNNTIQRCTLFNNITHGIKLDSSNHNCLIGNTIEGVRGASNTSYYGIFSSLGSCNFIFDCIVQNINGSAGSAGKTTAGIFLTSEKQSFIRNCLVDKIQGGASGSRALGIAALPLFDSITTGSCIIQNNLVTNVTSNGNGIGFLGSGTINIFINNEAQDNDQDYGADIPNVFNPTISTIIGTLQNVSFSM